MQKEEILEKYKCAECSGEFIIGQKTKRAIYAPVCPYCGTIDTTRSVSGKQEELSMDNFTIFIPEE